MENQRWGAAPKTETETLQEEVSKLRRQLIGSNSIAGRDEYHQGSIGRKYGTLGTTIKSLLKPIKDNKPK